MMASDIILSGLRQAIIHSAPPPPHNVQRARQVVRSTMKDRLNKWRKTISCLIGILMESHMQMIRIIGSKKYQRKTICLRDTMHLDSFYRRLVSGFELFCFSIQLSIICEKSLMRLR
mmetsp:Transcript_35979/g.75635  ORF Transcript_35979/g.75635 Transcript_35979/m.75635 type:complete len:117 (+) Transcript_35979:886-1236(+)